MEGVGHTQLRTWFCFRRGSEGSGTPTDYVPEGNVQPYIQNTDILKCPDSETLAPWLSYGTNVVLCHAGYQDDGCGWGKPYDPDLSMVCEANLHSASGTIMLADARSITWYMPNILSACYGYSWGYWPSPRHSAEGAEEGIFNAAWCDGHATACDYVAHYVNGTQFWDRE